MIGKVSGVSFHIALCDNVKPPSVDLSGSQWIFMNVQSFSSDIVG